MDALAKSQSAEAGIQSARNGSDGGGDASDYEFGGDGAGDDEVEKMGWTWIRLRMRMRLMNCHACLSVKLVAIHRAGFPETWHNGIESLRQHRLPW